MFKLNLKIALRNIWKNKVSSFINITGLAIGLAACLLLMAYIGYEWNFDKQSRNASNVYLAMTNETDDQGQISHTFDGTTTALGPLLKQGIPEVKYVSRMNYGSQALIANGTKAFKKLAKFAEPDIFKMYDYDFIAGNPATALTLPESVVITESTARVLFGSADVLNRTVRYQDKIDLNITGVIRDQPENSSNKFDYLMPWSFYETQGEGAGDLNWKNYNFVTLVYLQAGADPAQVNKKIDRLVHLNNKSLGIAAFQPHFIYPLSKLHLYGNFKNGKATGGDIEQIWLFGILAVGILGIACINFMNMATARSEKRAREVGIKKTIGANRTGLIFQFLIESVVLSLVSMVLAIVIIELFLPFFNNLLNIHLDIFYFSWYISLGILAVVLLTGLVAGSYPAFYLSSFHPGQILKGKIVKKGRVTFSLRSALVVGQFCFTILLIISTLVIYRQIQFVKNRPVGFDKNALVEMPQDGLLKNKFELLKSRLLKSGAVISMYESSVRLSHHGSNFDDISWKGMRQAQNKTIFNRVGTSYDFIKTNGIKLLAGRDFSKEYSSDSSAVLLSASAAQFMGLKNPLGQTVKIFGEPLQVIGVFEDYVWDSPYKSNNPMVVYFNRGHNRYINMRLNTANPVKQSIEAIERITKELNPAYPTELTFMSSVYADLFKKERTLGILSNLFGGLAVFISCLGLFGLVAYSAEQRTKEFGIRKVLGASVSGLMRLLSFSFFKLILVSVLIAAPLAYLIMGQWLRRFEFHTDVPWWILVLAAGLTFVLAFVTVSYQAYKVAVSNPVDALKYE